MLLPARSVNGISAAYASSMRAYARLGEARAQGLGDAMMAVASPAPADADAADVGPGASSRARGWKPTTVLPM